ncbi:hypothetical protein CAPTEDRAFT_189030 [Capitella teleta]|uniref:Uncharacterized protein n=1 Tax=Capitella teleta TaxID=283909 RepID=R7UT96_CAPTE|nr:hypothetical protein CAPTEDRAFT_189030 [Capitella teleta]|eukprot:ELU07132.1 hypothetical protein CAPTEDRAFT_189030 [Capitella teleta]
MSGSLPRVSEPGEAHYEVSSIEVSPPDPLRPQGQALVAVTRTAPVCINNFQNGCAHIIEDHIDTEGLKPPQRPKYLLSSSLPEGATDYCADYRTSAVTEDSNLPSEMSDTVGSDPSLDDKFKELDLEASGEDKIAAGKGLSRKSTSCSDTGRFNVHSGKAVHMSTTIIKQ